MIYQVQTEIFIINIIINIYSQLFEFLHLSYIYYDYYCLIYTLRDPNYSYFEHLSCSCEKNIKLIRN